MSTLTTHRTPISAVPFSDEPDGKGSSRSSATAASVGIGAAAVARAEERAAGRSRAVSRRSPRAGGRRAAVRPAGVRRPAARRSSDVSAAAAPRVDLRPTVTCGGEVRRAGEPLLGLPAVRPLRGAPRLRVGGPGLDRWDAAGRRDGGLTGGAPLTALPAQRVPGRRVIPDGVAAHAPRTARSAAVRLTRRGRTVVLLVSLGLALAAFTLIGPRSAATGEGGTPVQTRTVQVTPGDTLWGIASTVAAPGHVRDMVHQIEELNAMSGPSVTVGQRIAVPVG